MHERTLQRKKVTLPKITSGKIRINFRERRAEWWPEELDAASKRGFVCIYIQTYIHPVGQGPSLCCLPVPDGQDRAGP